MEITEFDVSLGQLVTRTLTPEEEAEILAIDNMGVRIVSYNISDTKENQLESVKSQFIEFGSTQEEAAILAEKVVK